MQIISHRGLWMRAEEKNSQAAFAESFRAGFGAEVDVRDLDGALVVSHDPPTRGALALDAVLEDHRRLGPSLPLALNVKSCGLASRLVEAICRFAVADCFVFDMAVPDALDYVRRGLPAYTRISEHEEQPAFLPFAAG